MTDWTMRFGGFGSPERGMEYDRERQRAEMEGKLRERKLLASDEPMPDFDTCLDAFVESARNIAEYPRRQDIRTIVFLDRGSRNIVGALQAAAEGLELPFPAIKFIDNHLLVGTSPLTQAWERTAEPPFLIVDEIAVSGESLTTTKDFLSGKYGAEQVFTAALTVAPGVSALPEQRGQDLTSLSLGYWYLSRSRPEELKTILNGTPLPDDLLYSPLRRNPSNAWFDERNPNTVESQVWRELDRFIRDKVGARARQVRRELPPIDPRTVAEILAGNMEPIDDILTRGDAAMLQKLRRLLLERAPSDQERQAIDARFDTAVGLQRLRRATHEQMKAEVKTRTVKNPVPTAEELSMGAFIEQLEPQVRDAVQLMRHKGYGTASSGFGGFDLQTINFSGVDFRRLPAAARTRLKRLGVEIDQRSLSFVGAKADLADLKRQWDEVATALPDRGRPAPEARHDNALDFRKKYGQG